MTPAVSDPQDADFGFWTGQPDLVHRLLPPCIDSLQIKLAGRYYVTEVLCSLAGRGSLERGIAATLRDDWASRLAE